MKWIWCFKSKETHIIQFPFFVHFLWSYHIWYYVLCRRSDQCAEKNSSAVSTLSKSLQRVSSRSHTLLNSSLLPQSTFLRNDIIKLKNNSRLGDILLTAPHNDFPITNRLPNFQVAMLVPNLIEFFYGRTKHIAAASLKSNFNSLCVLLIHLKPLHGDYLYNKFA